MFIGNFVTNVTDGRHFVSGKQLPDVCARTELNVDTSGGIS